MADERRVRKRVPLSHFSVVKAADGALSSVQISDVSATGMCLRSSELLPERGVVRLTLPGLAAEREFEAIHSKQAGEEYVTGIKFRPWEGSGPDPVQRYLSFMGARQAQVEFAGDSVSARANPGFGDRAPE